MKFSKPVQESADDFDIEALLENWPDSYYEERDPVNRRRLLDAADEAGLTPEDNAVRRNLYKKRYGRERRGIVQDNYLRMWMDFTFFVRNGNPKRSLRRDQAKIRKILKDTGFAEYAQADERAQQLLYRELYHLAMLYISVCAEDKGYNAVLLGFGHISNDRLIEKIEHDFRDVAVVLPRDWELAEEMALFTRAVSDAFADTFKGRERIDRKE
ncbi:MAG: DUF6553 family protein [Lachnospiraceae bacterium]|jgi:hypothetical protein